MDVSELADVSVELAVIGDVDDVSCVLVNEDTVLDVSVILIVVSDVVEISVVPRKVVFVMLMVTFVDKVTNEVLLDNLTMHWTTLSSQPSERADTEHAVVLLTSAMCGK